MPEAEFDFNVLTEITGGDATFERELLGEYLSGTAELLERHRTVLASRDFEQLQRVAHSLKGSSLTMGATRLGALAKEVEQSAHASDLARSAALVEDVLREFAALRPMLEGHMQRLAA